MADENQIDDGLPKITPKQEMFINMYFLVGCVGWKAAQRAGYSGDYNTLAATASRLLKNDNVSAHVQARMNEHAMSANEVLRHIGEIGRADIDDATDDAGNYDIKKARANGSTRLVKRIKRRTITTENSDIAEEEIEMHDRLRALELMGKHHKLFTEKLEYGTEDGKPIPILITGMDVNEL